MAKCGFCDERMHKVNDCVWARAHPEVHFPSGNVFRYAPYDGSGITCTGCGVLRGNFHHPDCEAQPCLQCRGTPVLCRCWDERHELKAVETAKEMLRAFGVAAKPRKRRKSSRRWQRP